MAVDLDNYKTVVDRLSQSTPIALNDENNIRILKLLYSEKHTITNTIENTEQAQPNTTPNTTITKITLEDFQKIITRRPK